MTTEVTTEVEGNTVTSTYFCAPLYFITDPPGKLGCLPTVKNPEKIPLVLLCSCEQKFTARHAVRIPPACYKPTLRAHLSLMGFHSLMPFHTLRSMPATLVAFMLMCATPASSSAPCSDPDPNRGGGLPPCECDVYHNGAFQCMSRMCSKPWGDIQVCYPTRVGHPGTDLEGRFFDNDCDDAQSMCSPWSPPGAEKAANEHDLAKSRNVNAEHRQRR